MIADLQSWQSLIDLGAALRERDFEVLRYTTRRTGIAPRARVALERIVFDQTVECLSYEPRAGVHLGGLLQILDAVRDVQAVDRVGAALLATPQWQSIQRLRRVHRADVNETDIYDKYVYSKLAEAAGVSIPETWLDPKAVPQGAELMVKMRVGSGGEGVAAVADASLIPSVLADMGVTVEEVLFQRRMHGELWNVGGVAHRGSVLVSAAYLVTAPESDPEGPPTMMRIQDNGRLLDATARVVESLGYTGPFAVDYIVGNAHYFLDFNPRFFGGWAVMQAMGIDLLGAYISVLEGQEYARPGKIPVTGAVPCGYGGGDGLRRRLAHNREVRRIAGPVLGRRWRGLAWVESLVDARTRR